VTRILQLNLTSTLRHVGRFSSKRHLFNEHLFRHPSASKLMHCNLR